MTNEGWGLLPWQQSLFTAKSHTMHYYCPKKHMYQMISKEAVRVSPCCHGNEISVVRNYRTYLPNMRLIGLETTKLCEYIFVVMAAGSP